jgi:hypothetical protein
LIKKHDLSGNSGYFARNTYKNDVYIKYFKVITAITLIFDLFQIAELSSVERFLEIV